jgi:hypothetical protein
LVARLNTATARSAGRLVDYARLRVFRSVTNDVTKDRASLPLSLSLFPSHDLSQFLSRCRDKLLDLSVDLLPSIHPIICTSRIISAYNEATSRPEINVDRLSDIPEYILRRWVTYVSSAISARKLSDTVNFSILSRDVPSSPFLLCLARQGRRIRLVETKRAINALTSRLPLDALPAPRSSSLAVRPDSNRVLGG